MLKSVMQKDKLALECAAKEYPRRTPVIKTGPLSDHRVTTSNQFSLPVLVYLMWTLQWPITDIQEIDRKARTIIVEHGGRHPCGSNAMFYLPREKEVQGREGRGARLWVMADLYVR